MTNGMRTDSQSGAPFPWWSHLCDCVAETFRFTDVEMSAFAENRTAKLIGAIPFVAGCEEPERTALTHLALYVTELRGGAAILGHIPADNASIFRRLRFIAGFSGGDTAVINHGMTWLALIMLVGYERSRDADARNHVYNPLNDGSWDAESLKAKLVESLKTAPCEALDAILNEGEAPFTW